MRDCVCIHVCVCVYLVFNTQYTDVVYVHSSMFLYKATLFNKPSNLSVLEKPENELEAISADREDSLCITLAALQYLCIKIGLNK